MAKTMTQSEYAKHRGVTQSCVSRRYMERLRQAGCITPSGKIKVEEADRFLDGSLNLAKRRHGYTDNCPASSVNVQGKTIRELLSSEEIDALEAVRGYFQPQGSGQDLEFGYLAHLVFFLELRRRGGEVYEVFDEQTGLLSIGGLFPCGATINGILEPDHTMQAGQRVREMEVIRIDAPLVFRREDLAVWLKVPQDTITAWHERGLQYLQFGSHQLYEWKSVREFCKSIGHTIPD